MGEQLSDLSIDFDQEILAEPGKTIEKMIASAGIQNVDIDKLVDLVAKPETGGWQQFETGEWFESVEGECDRLLNSLGIIKNFGRMPLAAIVNMNQSDWKHFGEDACRKAGEEALRLFAISRNEDLKLRNDLKAVTENYEELVRKVQRFGFFKRILLR